MRGIRAVTKLAPVLLIAMGMSGVTPIAVADDPIMPQSQTASDLLNACNASLLTYTGRSRRGYCNGFVSGVEEATRLMAASGGRRVVCAPPRSESRELVRAFSDYAVRGKPDLEVPAAAVVLRALEQRFPCSPAP